LKKGDAKPGNPGATLRELRLARGLSQSEAARRAAISPGALANWEAGRRMPRGAPLDRLLKVLEAPKGLRAAILSAVDPAHARIVLAHDPIGAPIPLGTMLRALRQRRGTTQAELAQALGVAQSTVASWEQGDGIPDAETHQTALYLLGASAEEATASLSWGATPKDHEALGELIGKVPHRAAEPLLLAYERELWRLATEASEWERGLIGAISMRAKWNQLQGRFGEVAALAGQAVRLTQVHGLTNTSGTGAFLVHAEMRLARGSSPLAIAREIEAWEETLPTVVERAWTMGIRARALAMAGVSEASRIAETALQLVEGESSTEAWFRRIDLARVSLLLGDPESALTTLEGVYDEFVLGILGPRDIPHGVAECLQARIALAQTPSERELAALRTYAQKADVPWYDAQVLKLEKSLARLRLR
jgi:transcriptional regulator with XRE-family HTH domain